MSEDKNTPHTRESEALKTALDALKHATVFISTREKMHSIGFAMHTAAIRQCEVAISTPIPRPPSDEMVAAAQGAYDTGFEFGISDDDMRLAIAAALNLMGGDTK